MNLIESLTAEQIDSIGDQPVALSFVTCVAGSDELTRMAIGAANLVSLGDQLRKLPNLDIRQPVQLEVGDIATPYHEMSLTREIVACERYFNDTYAYIDPPLNKPHGVQKSCGKGKVRRW